MTDDIAFDRSFALKPGVIDEVAPGVRRLLCDNPGPFTFKGTVSYIVGRGQVAIVDPGPDNPRHVAALLDAVRNETVTHIFVTHTHADHSPAAATVKAATGAVTLGEGPHRPARTLHLGEANRLEASADRDFQPDHALADGEIIAVSGFAIEAVATPGHTANHMAFALCGTDILFSGDHVMGWNTSIVAPPDGAMSDYMASLDKLTRRSEQRYLPGHGGEIREALPYVRQYIAHRHGREAAILGHLQTGSADIPQLVNAIYVGLDPRLAGAAALSVFAHLEDMVTDGRVATEGPPALASTYRLRRR
jgi:glyoxylase-like metal-dependent hydrolase (beta-lactamase superfamily II)